MMRIKTVSIVLAIAAASAACGKSNKDKQEPATASGVAPGTAVGSGTATTTTTAGTAAGPGVEAGGIERDKDEGGQAVVTAVTGTVEVRRVGELEYAAVKANTELYTGDVVRTGDGASANITLADETVVEVAEVSSFTVGSRDGTADPASSAAVLGGVARFSVSARAPGEGVFRVHTPSGIVITKGTVYAIGVAVTGEARVGVESGAVDVVGLADVAAAPVAVEAGAMATVDAAGTVAAPAAWTADDWGAWRAESEAKADASAVLTAHATAMAELEAQLATAYAELDAQAAEVASFEASAATAAEANATADYETASATGAAQIEASFQLAAHIEALTWAHAARAALATEVYVRNPDTLTAQWEVVAPRVDAAVLWPKRFEVTAAAVLTPMRGQYYIHHPRGRAHAALVGVAVPAFYAQAKVPDPDPVAVRAELKSKVWVAPVPSVKAQGRAVWMTAPPPGWRAKVKVKPAPVRARVGWYVRPPDAKATVLVGMPVKGKLESKVKVMPPQSRASLRATVKAPDLGTKVKVAPPHAEVGGAVHGEVKSEVKGTVGAGADVAVDAKLEAEKKAKAAAEAAAAAKAKAEAEARAAAEAAAKAKADIKAKADVKVKVTPPPPPKVEVKGKIEAKGGVKLGG